MASRQAPVLGGGTVSLDESAFEARFNMPLVHETVRAELNARRRGTASVKTRGEVRGGGAKPWRQKGTGRARQGSLRAPHFAGGGIAFGPSPRGYTVKVNRKARRAALRSALSAHAERGSVAVFDASVFDAPSSKQAAGLLADWDVSGPVLVLLSEAEADAGKSFRNLARVSVMPVHDAGVADVIVAASLLISEAALPGLVERAGAASSASSSSSSSGQAASADAESSSASGEPMESSSPEEEAADSSSSPDDQAADSSSSREEDAADSSSSPDDDEADS